MENFLAKKRLFSFLLAVVMLVSTAAPAFADVFMFITVEEQQSPVYTDGELVSDIGDCYVTVVYDADAEIPEGTELHLFEIPEGTIQYDEYRSAAEQTVGEDEKTVFVRFFDITLTNEAGEKVEPAAPVTVEIRAGDMNAAEKVTVVHFPEKELEISEFEMSGKRLLKAESFLMADAPSTGIGREAEPGAIANGSFHTDADSEADVAAEQETDDGFFGAFTDFPEADFPEMDVVAVREAEDGVIRFTADGFSVYGIVGTETVVVEYLSADGNAYEITVDLSEAANITGNAELVVDELNEETEAYAEYVSQISDKLGISAENLDYVKLFGISIMKDGREIQPDGKVRVSVRLLDQLEAFEPSVIHFGEETEVLDAVMEDDSIVFETSGFSVFAIVSYTVDFHFEDLTFSIQGESSILLSELFAVLGIEIELGEVESVAFSNDSLIRIEEIVTEENRRDWNLVSLMPFSTQEELTIALKDGSSFTICVTDQEDTGTGGSTGTPLNLSNYLKTSGVANEWQTVERQYAGNDESRKVAYDDRFRDEFTPDIRVQKDVVGTGVENEFYVYLSVDKPYSIGELFQYSSMAISTNNNRTQGSTYSGLQGNPDVFDGGGQNGHIAHRFTINLYDWVIYGKKGAPDQYGTLLTSYTMTLWGTTTPQCSNGSIYLQVPWDSAMTNPGEGPKYVVTGEAWLTLATGVNLHPPSTSGSGQPAVLNLGLQGNDILNKFSKPYTLLDKVTDVLGEDVEFIEIMDCDGTASCEDGVLTWDIVENLHVKDSANVTTQEDNWFKNIAQLVYKVRLKVDPDKTCADTITNKAATTAAGDTYLVNQKAYVEYDKSDTAKTTETQDKDGYPIELTNPTHYGDDESFLFQGPTVRGLLYDVSFKKLAGDTGEGLAGATFALARKIDGVECFQSVDTVTGEISWVPLAQGDSIREAIEAGYVTPFVSTGGIDRIGVNLTLGDYVLYEAEAPEGYYKSSPSRWEMTLCYTTDPNLLTPDTAPYEGNMRYSGKDDPTAGIWLITNPKDPIDIPELDPPEPPEPYVPDLSPTLSKQIDYLGNNDGVNDNNNPDTTLDDTGVAGLDDLYRLYLNLQGDSEAYDLVLVLDESSSMDKNKDMENSEGEPISRKEALLSFLNGEDGSGTGFIRDFLSANPQNRISVAGFSNNGKIELEWFGEEAKGTTVDFTLKKGDTSYVDGLYWADRLLRDRGDSDNQPLVIFLGDGADNLAYWDGLMHNGNEGNIVRGDTDTNPWPTFYSMMQSIYYYVTEGTYYKYTRNLNPDDFYQEYVGNNGYEPYHYWDRYYAADDSGIIVYALRDLQLEIPGFEAPNQITDADALIDFWENLVKPLNYYPGNATQEQKDEVDARRIALIESISRGTPRQIDIWNLAKNAFLDFAGKNSDAVVYTIGFSGALEGSNVDINGETREKSEVLEFYSTYGRGRYLPAPDAQGLADSINSICFMTNTEMTDTLSVYVQTYEEKPELKVVRTDEENNEVVVLYENEAPTPAGEEILQSVTLENGVLTVTFKPDYSLNPAYTYSASFNVKVTDKAYEDYFDNNKEYPAGAVGGLGTDYGDNATSSGNPGYFSNEEGKVTWTAGGEPDEDSFDDPVVQVHLADIIVRKVNENEDFIPGASFTLYDSKGMVTEFTVTEAEGVTIRDLRSGDYRLVETHSPAGYVILNNEIRFHVNAAGILDTITWGDNTPPENTAIGSSDTNDPKFDVITVTNTSGVELPATGARGAAAYTVAGLAMLTAVGLVLRERKKKEE